MGKVTGAGRGLWWVVLGLPIGFFAVFYFYPLAAILRQSFAAEAGGFWGGIGELVSRPFYWRTLWFTTWQAVVSTGLTLLLALPGAYVFARYTFPGKSLLKAISTLPFVLPTVVVAAAFTALLGPRGIVNEGLMALFDLESPPVNLQFSIWIILLAHVFYNYSVSLRLISGYWQNLNPTLEQAARMLGASPRRVFWSVTLPLLRPAIGAAAVLVFIFTFTSFGVILILGGPRYSTLETEIYRQAVNLFNLPAAAALSLLQILITFILIWFYTGSQATLARAGRLRAAGAVQRPVRTWRQRLLVGGNLGLMLLLLGAPLLALIGRSLTTEAGLSLFYYARLFVNDRDSLFFVPPITAVANSTGIALATTAAAVLLGGISALVIAGRGRWGRWLDPLFMLPLATSAVTLGFGFILALNRPPFNLRTSLILVPIAHTLVALPFVLRAVLPALRRIPASLREAGAVLGASPWQIGREIIWPLVRPALLVGAVFAFTISMGEFGASIFVTRPANPTMPVAIGRFFSQPGAANYGQALAMSTLLLLVCAAGFILIERFRFGDEGEF